MRLEFNHIDFVFVYVIISCVVVLSETKKIQKMEVHCAVNHASAKRFWNVLRIAAFMIRKGSLISKRKILMDMHLMRERGKVYGRSIRNLVFHHSRGNNHGGFGLQEYEFSCSNSPAIFHTAKKKHHYFPTNILHFPCIYPHEVEDKEEPNTIVFPKLDYSNEYFSNDCLDPYDLPAVQKPSPLLSPLCGRISSSSNEDDNDNQVDRQAEEFIAKFYEQLRLQNQMSLLQYQEMLDRGTT
jgi:hypothetical protein